ncbi:hypothetical protein AGMMS50239_12260 [Bacteroidia bacterium]|nr:hypothetical protein AGMMS50239_12260 [Bacteroidia bacterium]
MRNLFINLSIVACGLLCFACSENVEESVLNLSVTDIHLDASGTEQQIKVETNEILWQISGNPDWISIKRDSCFLIISADNNPTRESRSAKIAVVAGDKHVRVDVSQAEGLRALGELYPDAINPVGVIFKLMDGGKHGKVIGFNETVGVWGPRGEPHLDARDLYNGRKNTLTVLGTRKDQPNFQTDYPVFYWLLNEINGGDMNGMWYIPAYYELLEMHAVVTGNKLVIPATLTNSNPVYIHNSVVRDYFNNQIMAYGGVPFSFTNKVHFSSSEYDLNQARCVMFANNILFTNLSAKSELNVLFRPILEF